MSSPRRIPTNSIIFPEYSSGTLTCNISTGSDFIFSIILKLPEVEKLTFQIPHVAYFQ